MRITIIFVAFFVCFPVFSKPSEEFGAIEILFDTWGVPHVYSDTDEGAYYGLGYATAQQRGFQMYYTLRIIQGRLAELVGKDFTNEQGETAVQSDCRMRILGYHRSAKSLIPTLDQQTVSLLQAYADGVNDYIRNNPGKLSYLFRQYHLKPETWTPAECIVSWWYFSQFMDGNKFQKSLTPPANHNTSPIRDEEAAIVKKSLVSEEWLDQVNRFAQEYPISPQYIRSATSAPMFGHTWVIGKDKSKDSGAVLCSNLQAPVRNPSVFHEFHISGENFNARGIGIPGSPILFVGWNKYVAWGITPLGADQADIFKLTVNEENQNQYRYNDTWKEIRSWEETVYVKDATPETVTIKETDEGPIVTSLITDASPENLLVLKYVPLVDREKETVQSAIAMMQATDMSQFAKATENWRTPSAHVVFGDVKGNIAYRVIGGIPLRATQTIKTTVQTLEKTGQGWMSTIPPSLLPHLGNPKSGYLISANHLPAAAFYPLDLRIQCGITGDTAQSWRLRERLEQKNSFIAEEILDIQYDTVNPIKRDILRLGYAMRDRMKIDLSDNALKTLAYLHEWYKKGGKIDRKHPGAEVAHIMTCDFQSQDQSLISTYGPGVSGLCYFLRTTQNKLHADPPEALSKEEIAFISRCLSETWLKSIQTYGDNPAKWYGVWLQKIPEKKLLYYQTLDGFPSLDPSKNIPVPSLSCIENGTVFSLEQQAYMQWVPLQNVDQALSLLPIGQEEQPGSPFRKNHASAWTSGELHPAPLTRTSVEKFTFKTIRLD
jgi:penicillin G amidase